MALKRPPQPACMTLNLAPMVDVMMCLIIFFLLASKLVQAEQFKVDLPWAVKANEVESSDLGARVSITVRRVDEQDEQAQYVVVEWDGEAIVERVLAPQDIEALLRARAVRAAQDNQKIRCVVRADRMVMYRHVEVVLRACGFANISDVVFSVNKGAEPETGA